MNSNGTQLRIETAWEIAAFEPCGQLLPHRIFQSSWKFGHFGCPISYIFEKLYSYFMAEKEDHRDVTCRPYRWVKMPLLRIMKSLIKMVLINRGNWLVSILRCLDMQVVLGSCSAAWRANEAVGLESPCTVDSKNPCSKAEETGVWHSQAIVLAKPHLFKKTLVCMNGRLPLSALTCMTALIDTLAVCLLIFLASLYASSWQSRSTIKLFLHFYE